MKSGLSPKVVAVSLAAVSAIASLLCAVALALFPQGAFNFFGSIFHGIDLSQISTPITLSGVFTGLIAVIIIGFLLGWLFALIYNYFIKKF